MNSLSAPVALALLVTGTAAFAQAKPVTRADFVKNLDARFTRMDTNRDGKVTRDELAAELQREMEQAKATINQQLTVRFRQLDTNKDGQLSLQEFLAAAPPLRANETPDQLLARLDANKDGKVTADEYRAPELARFNKADTNHDGTVTPDELKAASGRK